MSNRNGILINKLLNCYKDVYLKDEINNFKKDNIYLDILSFGFETASDDSFFVYLTINKFINYQPIKIYFNSKLKYVLNKYSLNIYPDLSDSDFKRLINNIRMLILEETCK